MRSVSSFMRVVLPALLLVVAACGGEAPSKFEFPPIPDKTVVLTFDDAKKSHRTFVGPLLREYGFGATFFVTPKWMDETPDSFMTWEEIAELHRMGFEIGNHTWNHCDYSVPELAMHLGNELTSVERALARVGVPKPLSFAWPVGSFGPESITVLENHHYMFSRRGLFPETPLGGMQHGPLYDPARHHPHLVPTSANAEKEWTFAFFEETVNRAREGQAVVLQFHGVPDLEADFFSISQDLFRRCMAYLKDGGYNVIAMRDLARHVDPTAPVDDLLRHTRFP